ncbi:MAG TPA: hypothetical protein VFD23_05420, partial [Clostridia bacterium]|nr:hypothetical protein [Clostridia bacterium]
IYTVKRDHAKTDEINETLEELSSAGIDVVGSILTMSNKEGAGKVLSRRNKLCRYSQHRNEYGKDCYTYSDGLRKVKSNNKM